MPRPRFTLRVLIVAMTLLCVWCAYSFNWIRRRQAVFAASGAVDLSENAKATAPGLLFLFGERGYRTIGVAFERAGQIDHFADLQLLFPEAEVCTMYRESSPRQASRPWPWAGPEVEDPETFWGQTLLPRVTP